MIKKATALLALVALCGFLPAAAQEPQQEKKLESKKMVDPSKKADEAKAMADEAEKKVEMMADEAEKKAETMADEAEKKAETMADEAEKKAETMADDMPTLEEVMQSHYEALGGTDAWKSVDSVRFEGTMSMGPGMEAPFKMTMKRPDNIRLEFDIQGMTGIQASDGETAWMVMPFMGKKDPEEMPADMADQLEEQADIEGPLFDWADKGHEVELLGKEDVEGTAAYKVKLTRENGDVRYHYLDGDYYLTIRQEGKTTVQGQEMDIETTIGDYKEVCLATSTPVDDNNPCDGDRLVLPHSIESKAKGSPVAQVITITSVAINPGDIADDEFAMPAKPDPAGQSAESGS